MWVGRTVELIGLVFQAYALYRTWKDWKPSGESFLAGFISGPRKWLAIVGQRAATLFRRMFRRRETIKGYADAGLVL